MDVTGARTPVQRRATKQSGMRARRLWALLRHGMASQVRLWDRTLDDLRPWEQEGPLRWRGGHLEGATLDAEALHPARGTDVPRRRTG
jgi:hypothetical protein